MAEKQRLTKAQGEVLALIEQYGPMGYASLGEGRERLAAGRDTYPWRPLDRSTRYVANDLLGRGYLACAERDINAQPFVCGRPGMVLAFALTEQGRAAVPRCRAAEVAALEETGRRSGQPLVADGQAK